MAEQQHTMITQAYFDELCLENQELFEGTQEEAVQETITQLLTFDKNKDKPSNSIQHLCQTFPTPDCSVRPSITQLTLALQSIQTILVSEDNVASQQQQLLQDVTTVQRLVVPSTNGKEKQPPLLVHLFVALRGVSLYMKLWLYDWETTIDNENAVVSSILEATVQTLHKVPPHNLQSNIPPTAWMAVWKRTVSTTPSSSLLLLEILKHLVTQNEANKQQFMALSAFPKLLMDHTLKEHPDAVCVVIAKLCTFDEFSTAEKNHTTSSSSPTGAIVQQSSTENALKLANAVPKLVPLLHTRPSTAILQALRSMAIHNDVVTSMLEHGIMTATQELMEEQQDALSSGMSQSIVGLFRNLSGSDHVKRLLCQNKPLLRSIGRLLQVHSDNAVLQEHGAGLSAALALRQPEHAALLVELDFPCQILSAMKNFPNKVTLQRQGCLALRNLVSRSPSLRQAVLDQGAEEILRTIASRHLACQDEVYAALRDLGRSVVSVTVTQHEDGTTQVVKGVEMFGETKSNFRAVY